MGWDVLMCRLFGLLSAFSISPYHWLVSAPCSLLRQSSAVPRKLQGDGWGFALNSEGICTMLRSTGAVYQEPKSFSDLSRQTVQGALVHIRRASNPLRLPREKLLAMENIQPFHAHGWWFAHNGQLNDPKGAAEGLGSYKGRVQGRNDSEVLFWHFVKALDECEDVPLALRTMEERVVEHSAGEPFSALNVIVTNWSEMHAYCRYTRQPRRSLCSGVHGYYIMCYRLEKEMVVIMSEPSDTDEGWRPLDNSELLSAELVDGKIETRVRR